MKALLLALAAIGFTNFAQARESKTIDVYFFSTRTYYSCDFAESQTEKILEKIGAQDIKVRCSGGLPYYSYVDVRADFTVATNDDDDATYNLVEIKTDDSCDLNERILDEAFATFSTLNLNSSGVCWDSQGRLKYTAEVLK